MNPLLIAALYFILWWLCFFAVLPIGVRSIEDTGEQGVEGHDRGAPVAPNLLQKALWAAGGAAVLLAIVVAALYAVYFGRPLS